MNARGDVWEAMAARYLRRRGWRILARNWRGGGGELDIVAARAGTLLVVEVKARADVAALDEPIGFAQRGRLLRAAEAFLARRAPANIQDVRIDLIAVHTRGRPFRRLRHVRNAVTEDYAADSSNSVRGVYATELNERR
jgi:putative endonuclease